MRNNYLFSLNSWCRYTHSEARQQQRVCMWFRGVTWRKKSTPENSLTPTRVRVAPVHHRDHCTRAVCAVEFNIRAHGVLCKEKVRNSQQGGAIILNNLTLHWHYRGEFATLSARAFIETVPEGIVSVVSSAVLTCMRTHAIAAHAIYFNSRAREHGDCDVIYSG